MPANLTRALLAALLLGLALGAQALEPPPGLLKLGGRTAPELQLSDLDGEPWRLSESRGHWVFVHFWASWCGPCRQEMPTIQTLSGEIDASELKIALVNTAEDEDTVFAFLAAVAPDLNPLLDRDGQVTEAWQPRGLPATFLVDPEGRLRHAALGGRPWDQPEYLAFLRALIGAAP